MSRPKKSKDKHYINPNSKPWKWLAPEYRDDNYDGVVMESKEALEAAAKIRKKIDKELRIWLKRS